MSTLYFVGAVVATGLLVYLFAALLVPEKLQ
ncbi:MAG: K(+)-transporting ATPase subunit F [Sandaracinus sp.]